MEMKVRIERCFQTKLGRVPDKYRVREDANLEGADNEDRLAACLDWFDPEYLRWRSLGSGRLRALPPSFGGCYLRSLNDEPIPKPGQVSSSKWK